MIVQEHEILARLKCVARLLSVSHRASYRSATPYVERLSLFSKAVVVCTGLEERVQSSKKAMAAKRNYCGHHMYTWRVPGSCSLGVFVDDESCCSTARRIVQKSPELCAIRLSRNRVHLRGSTYILWLLRYLINIFYEHRLIVIDCLPLLHTRLIQTLP